MNNQMITFCLTNGEISARIKNDTLEIHLAGAYTSGYYKSLTDFISILRSEKEKIKKLKKMVTEKKKTKIIRKNLRS